MLGTHFELFNHGLPSEMMSSLPKGFYPKRKVIQTIEYDSNFFAERPRAFKVLLSDPKSGQLSEVFENLPPKFNRQKGCYTLNFFGRVAKASARNFQLVPLDCTDSDDLVLSHGKQQPNLFNLDFRAPFCQLFAFAVSLSAIGKKRVVG
jgi:hypothetical protein